MNFILIFFLEIKKLHKFLSMDNFVKSDPSFFESMATIKVYRWQVLFFLKYPIYLCIAQLAFDHPHPLPLCQTGTLETFLALFYRFLYKETFILNLVVYQ